LPAVLALHQTKVRSVSEGADAWREMKEQREQKAETEGREHKDKK
jgi:hypothetical protein